MENNNREIRDDEFRVLGNGAPFRHPDPAEDSRRKRMGGWVAFTIVALLGLGMVVFWPKGTPEEVEGVFESSYETESVAALGTESMQAPYAERIDTVVSGHALVLFIPHHATPRLYVGNPDEKARQAVMAFQAADIRADNREILGEFVLAGEQLSRGVSKRGYCAIIDGKVSIGVGDHTPLLSEAVSGGGYFFRQYPLVDQGVPVDNKPKNKTIRKALCDRAGQIFVAVSAGDETFSDFARTLVALGVENAIYLVGSDVAFGWAVNADGAREKFGNDEHRAEFRNESYVLWE